MNDKKDIPEYLGRYRMCEQIAKGGMAKIYRATDEIIGRDVAVKVTDRSDSTWDNLDTTTVMKQFSMEVQISGQLSHHSFVTIYDAGMEGELCYLVMELMDGVTLNDVIRKNKLNIDTKGKLDILVQVARALHYSHQRGIIHRDIKPSNIMILKNGQVKVLDFGVSYVSAGSTVRITSPLKDPGVGGTPYYMSPEQVSKHLVDGHSDLFSLAVVSYELFTGKRPFTADKLIELYENILRQDPAPIRSVNSSVPEKVATIIMRCLNKDPELRLDSCKVFADQLDEIINDNFFDDEGEIITNETLTILRRYRESFSFFFDLDNQQLYKLLRVCQSKKFSKGDVIFNEGEVARDMYLLVSGQIKILRGPATPDAYVIHILKRGDIFGEMGIIDGGPRSASAIADSDCQVLTIHQVSLLRCDENTSGKIYRNLAHILSTKLRATSSKLDDISNHANL